MTLTGGHLAKHLGHVIGPGSILEAGGLVIDLGEVVVPFVPARDAVVGDGVVDEHDSVVHVGRRELKVLLRYREGRVDAAHSCSSTRVSKRQENEL